MQPSCAWRLISSKLTGRSNVLQGGSASSEQLEELEGEESGSIVLGDCVRSRRIEGHLRVGYASTDCRWGTRGVPSCGKHVYASSQDIQPYSGSYSPPRLYKLNIEYYHESLYHLFYNGKITGSEAYLAPLGKWPYEFVQEST